MINAHMESKIINATGSAAALFLSCLIYTKFQKDIFTSLLILYLYGNLVGSIFGINNKSQKIFFYLLIPIGLSPVFYFVTYGIYDYESKANFLSGVTNVVVVVFFLNIIAACINANYNFLALLRNIASTSAMQAQVLLYIFIAWISSLILILLFGSIDPIYNNYWFGYDFSFYSMLAMLLVVFIRDPKLFACYFLLIGLSPNDFCKSFSETEKSIIRAIEVDYNRYRLYRLIMKNYDLKENIAMNSIDKFHESIKNLKNVR